PLAPFLGRGQLLLLPPPHRQDLVAVVALLLLGERLVSLALGGELHRLLLARRRDRLLVLLAQLADLGRQPLACRRLLLRPPTLQGLDLPPVREVGPSLLGLPGRLRGGHLLPVLVVEAGHLGAVPLLELRDPGLELGARPLRLHPPPDLLLHHALLEAIDLVVRLAQLHVSVVDAGFEGLLALPGLLPILRQLGDPLVGSHQVALEAERGLLEIAPRA